MSQFVLFCLTVFFLTGTFFLTSINSVFRRIHRKDAKKQLKALGNLFFYRRFHLYFFPQHEYEGVFLATLCTQNVIRLAFAVSAFGFLSETPFFHQLFVLDDADPSTYLDWLALISSGLCLLFTSIFVGDYLPRIFGTRFPGTALRISAPFASFFLVLVFPISYLFLKISQTLSPTSYFDPLYESITETKQEMIDIIQKANLSPTMDEHEKKLVESVVTFKERIVREVMVPRVDVFSLSADTPIKEATALLENEGFSRTPVFRNTVDNIVGVLMYKDIINKYREYQEKGNDIRILEAPIETLLKSVLYTPETKKISSLLQEFRKKQMHFAIVVDEYGGTEGIVTIEDILEEIVGEIADEYDKSEELYTKQPGGSGWIVDARMSISDAEEELGIQIPQDAEFDTIGGYIFHIAGTIPSKGFIIHHDQFELEILSSNERCVEKVRIKPVLLNQKNSTSQ